MDDINVLISIVVPVYKVEQYLDTCIKSVLSQTYEKWEMILVDDGSPDHCGKICDDYACKDSRIRVLHTKNGGLSAARNNALDSHPKGEFVTFLDSDDFWHHDYLKNMVELQHLYNADLIQCGCVVGQDTSFPDLKEKVRNYVFDNHKIFLSEKANITMWGKIYRMSLFEDIRMPVGLYNEDDWTTWKLYYKCKTIVVTSQRMYYYTKNPTSIMANLAKKPDLRYINAYKERIGFFVNTGETDLEHFSRLVLCKSLVLSYKSKLLSRDECGMIMDVFKENWRELKQSPYIKYIYKILFTVFSINPKFASNLVAKIKG